MSFLGTVLGVVGTVAGVVTGNPALIAAGVSTTGASLGNSAQTKAINKAVDTYSQGAQQAGKILSEGYDAAKIAKLDALAKIGALTPEQMDATIRAIDAGQTQFIDTMIATGEGYAAQMNDGGQAYREALTGAGQAYGADLTDLGITYGKSLNQAAQTYGTDINAVAQQYGGEIEALAQQLGVDFETAANVFAQGLNSSAQQYTGDLVSAAEEEKAALGGVATDYAANREKGLKAVASSLTPYAEGQGTESLDYMRTLMNADPSQLDPAQQRMREQFIRDLNARLAASGLRGAGRAGVAAVNEGDAELRARLYTENRDRATGAANTLLTTGRAAAGDIGAAGERAYTDIGNVTRATQERGIGAVSSAKQTGATYGANARATGLQAVNSAADRGAVARQTAGNTAAQARANAGELAATTRRDYGKTAADTGLRLGESVATQQLALGKDAALNDQDTARKIAGVNLDIGKDVATQGLKAVDFRIAATDRGYTQARDTATKIGEAEADAALGKAGAQAGAVSDPAWIAAQAALAKGNLKSDTIGAISSSVADLLKPKTTTG